MIWSSLDLSFWIRFFTAVLGTIAFALIFRSKLRYLPVLAVGGGLGYAIYYACSVLGISAFGASLASAVFFSLYAEIFARIKHAPAIIFILPCAIPIVPGSSLYYAMSSLISRDFSTAWYHFEQTIMVGIGIAGGILAVSIVFQVYAALASKLQKKKK